MPALLRATGLRYLGVSVMALGVDMGCFLVLLRLGMVPALASALAYGLGVGAHWWFSARMVFDAGQGAARWVQKGRVMASALVGLGLTAMVVGAGSAAGFDPRLAKIAAVGISFLATYALRSLVVFRPRAAA